jgi:hypothetical protein
MPGEAIEWVPVTGNTGRRIGAVGFIGERVAVAVAFYDDADADQDGSVSLAERAVATLFGRIVSLKGKAITEVVMAARNDPDIMIRDPSYRTEAAKQFLDFATGLVFDALYTVYFSRGVKSLATGTAGLVADGVVRQYVIRKGMEKAVKAAYDAAIRAQTAFSG